MIELFTISNGTFTKLPYNIIGRTDVSLVPQSQDVSKSPVSDDNTQSLEMVINERDFITVLDALNDPWLYIGYLRDNIKLSARVITASVDVDLHSLQTKKLKLKIQLKLLTPWMALSTGWGKRGMIRGIAITDAAQIPNVNMKDTTITGKWICLETGQLLPYPIEINGYALFIKPGLDLAPYATNLGEFYRIQKHYATIQGNQPKLQVFIGS